MEIDFNDETGMISNEHMELVKQLLLYAAEQEDISPEAEVSISFVNDDEIHRLNKQFRQIDRPTDVLSFALEEQVEGELAITGAALPVVLGDIIISVDKITEQAEQYNHSFTRELGFLTVHGLLHLIGYDHMNKEDEQKMFTRQEEILNDFGLSRKG
ncbi:rRNA maturation RNase YbeY [Gracilibacillus alcaliphilus]|uniref:rRNA maturation RNase YbeY n=1 Tax=Gracilibacillus alcaliphilus TaxID=1401441 RepID=UPI001959ED77|nr:rRNA maturation RNase YbeY [Gracilibacillus alcaliphilus]MBM7674990.1 putative rRNA maturation factor [Gracilibacillus alcaliphilus]